MKLYKLLVFTSFLATIPFWANAQDDLNKTVHVTTVYDPIISDAEKIELPVNFNDTLFLFKPNYKYSIKPQEITSSISLRPIPAAEIKESAYKDPKWLYAKVGAGYPLQFLGDLYLQNIKPENLSYGLYYNHRSIWAKIDNPDGEKIPVDELNHNAGIYLGKSLEKLAFSLTGGFEQHNVLFYGYNTIAAKRAGYVFNKDSLAQSYTSFNLAARINSIISKESAFHYDLKLLFDMFGDNGKGKFNTGRMFSMGENKIGAKLLIGTAFGEGTHLVSLKADGNLFFRELSYNKKFDAYFASSNLIYNRLYNDLFGLNGTGKDISDNNYIFNLHPTYSYSSQIFDIELGVKYTGFKKTAGFQNRFYPVAGVRFKLADEFVPFAGISGETLINDYKTVATQNPYIRPGMNMAMKTSNYAYVINAGFKGNIENIFAYNVYGKYSLINDWALFVNSDTDAEFTALGNNFDVVYDDVQQFKAGLDLKFSFRPVEAVLSGAYYYCVMDKQPVPFHLPQMVASLDVNVAATKALNFNFNANYNSEIPYFYSLATEEVLCEKMLLNLGLGAEYLFNRSFSVFLNAANLLNSKHGIWHGYKLPGISVLGGVTFKL